MTPWNLLTMRITNVFSLSVVCRNSLNQLTYSRSDLSIALVTHWHHLSSTHSHNHTHKHIANNNPNYTHTIIHQPSCSIIEWFVYLYTSNKSLYHSYHTLDVDCGRFDLNAPRRGQSRIEHVWQWSTTTKQHTNFQIKYFKSSSYI